MSQPPKRGVSRRSFLKGSAVAGIATTGLSAAADRPNAPPGPETFGPGEHEVTLRINGEPRRVRLETRTTLLDALRDRCDLTGAKKICDRGACGGCTVIVDDVTVNSCLMLAMDAVGSDVRTVEGLQSGERPHPLVENFVQCDALQCGFCTPGMVMSSLSCLEKRGRPTAEQMRRDLSGNICRCGTYGRVMDAIQRTSGQAADGPRTNGGDK